MKNYYVEKYNEIIVDYNKKQKELNHRIKANNERFTPEYSKSANEPIEKEKEQLYEETVSKIKNVFENVRDLLAKANFFNVEDLTNDRLLFDNNIDYNLNEQEVKAYVQRYENNYSMLRHIKNWVEKHNEITEQHPAGKYSSIDIIMPDKMIEAYKHFGEGALYIANRIYKEQETMQSMIELNIATFTDDKFTSGLLDVVGNGLNISDFKSKRVPDIALHVFDNVKVEKPNGNYYAM